MVARLETSYQWGGQCRNIVIQHDVQRPARRISAPLANRHDRIVARLPLRFLARRKLAPQQLGRTISYECILGAVSLQKILTLTLQTDVFRSLKQQQDAR